MIVAGNDGKTYGNPCDLKYSNCLSGAKIIQAYAGACNSII